MPKLLTLLFKGCIPLFLLTFLTKLPLGYVKPETSATQDLVQPNTQTLFAPMVQNSYKALQYTVPVKFGVDFNFVLDREEVRTHDLPLVNDLGVNWTRYWLGWHRIEIAPGQYDWSEPDIIINRLRETGFEISLEVYGIPEWASGAGDVGCGPIADMAAFEQFLQALLERYGTQIAAWEFMNEPDAREPYLPWHPVIGCWGREPEAYATQLGIFYDRIKTYNPDLLVLFGGLTYDNWDAIERDFFEQTLQAGAGDFFDVVSFHYYPVNPIEFPTVTHKVVELQDIMARNSVQNKRIWLTETAMWINYGGSLEAQRNFLIHNYARGYCSGIETIFWFGPIEPLRVEDREHPERWFINLDHEPDNAHDSFQHLINQIGGTFCKGQYQAVPAGVEVYHYAALDRSVYVVWSTGVTETVVIPISANSTTLSNHDGSITETIPVVSGQVQFDVDVSPVFLEVVE